MKLPTMYNRPLSAYVMRNCKCGKCGHLSCCFHMILKGEEIFICWGCASHITAETLFFIVDK